MLLVIGSMIAHEPGDSVTPSPANMSTAIQYLPAEGTHKNHAREVFQSVEFAALYAPMKSMSVHPGFVGISTTPPRTP